MKESQNIALKKFLGRTILIGVIGAAVALTIAFFSTKEYLVTGKLVVFPTSSLTGKNLGYEVGNTAEIIKNTAFQENVFGEMAENFAGAKVLEGSSAVEVSFFAQPDEETLAEDAIVRIPEAVAEYARDLYGGNPFKYKSLGDPEILANPVRPNLFCYLAGGFGIGVLISALYWFLFEFLRVPAEDKYQLPEKFVSPQIEIDQEAITEEKKEQPAPKATRIIEPVSRKEDESTVPENLPTIEMETGEKPQPAEEPSDEEVKDRLNKLMRGEL
ncbi:MAG: hypothetical protein PHF35_02105 [Candidatus Moranbacteria bacterium]|nr:hypothetical protein [Candidatus Moranbacteria bacterium]